MSYYRVIILSLLILFVFSCDEDAYTPVPYASINYKLNLNFSDKDLIPPISGVKTFTEPRAGTDILSRSGILIINGIGDNLDINLYAYDLACPVEAKKDSIVRIIPNDVGQAQCPHCNAIFEISHGHGNALSGSKYPLRSYSVVPRGNLLYIVKS